MGVFGVSRTPQFDPSGMTFLPGVEKGGGGKHAPYFIEGARAAVPPIVCERRNSWHQLLSINTTAILILSLFRFSCFRARNGTGIVTMLAGDIGQSIDCPGREAKSSIIQTDIINYSADCILGVTAVYG